MNWSTGSN